MLSTLIITIHHYLDFSSDSVDVYNRGTGHTNNHISHED